MDHENSTLYLQTINRRFIMKKPIRYGIFIVLFLTCFSIGIYAFFPGTVIKAMTEFSKWKGGIDTKSVQVDKHLWPYLEGGSLDKETIVFVHGFGSSKEPWISMIAHFGKTYHVLAPDLPGFARNEYITGESYIISDQVVRLNDFLLALGIERVHLLGVSMGGFISAYYAAQYPEKLLSLALMDAAGVQAPIEPDYISHLKDTGENLLIPEDVDGFKKMLEIIYHAPPKIPARFIDFFFKVRQKRLKVEALMFQDLIKSLEDPLEKYLSLIKTNTLIMWGDKDRVVDISAVPVFEKGILHHQTVIFKNVGHVPFLEAQEKTNSAYQDFLTDLR
jgi:pimeloyl-ACP methyl ester carboxylesterase